MVNVTLDPESSDNDDILCSVTANTCTAIITRDIYTVIVRQTNNIGTTVDTIGLDCKKVHIILILVTCIDCCSMQQEY